MSLLEQQNFLARIFTDENLRLAFWENPELIGKEYGLDDEEIAQIKKIVEADLNFFANSLFQIRLHEVEKLLPLTKKSLEKEFAEIFKRFSQTYQPKSVKKHLEDAIEFCKYLQMQQFVKTHTKEAAKFERAKHEFFSQQKYLTICVLKNDVFSLKKKISIAVWYRIGNKSHYFIL